MSDPWADQPEKVVDIKVMAFPLNILELPKGFSILITSHVLKYCCVER